MTAGIGARLMRCLLLVLLAVTAGGCVWLQNEFFVYDAPPEPVPQPAANVPW